MKSVIQRENPFNKTSSRLFWANPPRLFTGLIFTIGFSLVYTYLRSAKVELSIQQYMHLGVIVFSGFFPI